MSQQILELISLQQACKISGICRRTLYRLMGKKQFPLPHTDGIKTGRPYKLLFVKSEIDNWASVNNPVAIGVSIVRQKEICEITNLHPSTMSNIKKLPDFPRATVRRGVVDYYLLDEIINWFSIHKPKYAAALRGQPEEYTTEFTIDSAMPLRTPDI